MGAMKILDVLNEKEEKYFNLCLEALENSKLASVAGNHEEAKMHMGIYDEKKAKMEAIREVKTEILRMWL